MDFWAKASPSKRQSQKASMYFGILGFDFLDELQVFF
jgi:hypothetical protein